MSHQEGVQLELYKLAVDMADRVSARRGTANSFFLALNTALAGIAGFVRPFASGTGGIIRVDVFGVVLVAVVGLVLSAAWWLLLKSYRDLNEAKFKVINAMEEKLPAQPFGHEWRYLKEDPIKRKFPARYAELNAVERIVPMAFAIVYIAIGVRAVWS